MKNKFSIQNVLIAVVLLVVVVNVIVMARLTSNVSEKLDAAAELNRPAMLSAVIINPVDCTGCFDIAEALEGVKKANVKIEDEKQLSADDPEAQELIAKYDIKKLPTIVFTGEIRRDPRLEESWAKIGELKDDAVVFTNLQPPYFDVDADKVAGQVTITYINDSGCAKCTDFQLFVNQLKETGVTIAVENKVDYTSVEGKELIKKYGITQVPTVIMSSDISVYEAVVTGWNQFGKVADDGSLVATLIPAPYRDVASNKIKGLVSVTNLVDSSCAECLKTSAIKNLFTRFGIKYDGERTVDVSSTEGAALVKKYNIESVPTLILDSEAEAYPALKKSWSQVGTIESDGSYVVRKLSILKGAKYKDLISGSVISN